MLVYRKHNLITVVFIIRVYIKLPLSLSGLVSAFNCLICLLYMMNYYLLV